VTTAIAGTYVPSGWPWGKRYGHLQQEEIDDGDDPPNMARTAAWSPLVLLDVRAIRSAR